MKSVFTLAINTWHYLLHHLLRFAPIEATSALGGKGVRLNVRFNRREIYTNALANVRHHKPELAESEARRIVDSYLDNVGRVMAEFSIVHRMTDRISFSNLPPIYAFYTKRPILAIILHTGNWEMFGPALTGQGIKVTSFYEPPENSVHRKIVEQARQRVGFDLLTPDFAGVRQAMSLLRQNKVVAIFGDEARKGVAMAPLFGRPPHPYGNLAIAAKLARRTDATIVVGHCERQAQCQFVLHLSDPFQLATDNNDLLEDVAFLNAKIEPIILQRLSSWYYLDDRLDEVGPEQMRTAS